MTAVQIELPKKLIPIFQGEADARCAYGGRGSAKTRSFALMVAIKGYIFGKGGIKGQLLCARQFMNSLADSSLEECKRAIEQEPFLLDYYDIGENYIKSKDGNIAFSFAGLDRNIGSVKSKGRILVCWVDEAEDVSDYSWTVLIPTLREEGEGWNAELYVTWNPRRKGSPTDLRFRKSKDPRYKVVQLNWRDNPKFPAVLERQRQRDLVERPDEYDHVWEGAYGSAQGAILAKWVSQAEREGRIKALIADPLGAPLLISSDIGFRDTAGWWFWQPQLGGYKVLKYIGESGFDADDWIPKLGQAITDIGIPLGRIWLPHDARAKTFQSKHSTVEKFLAAFGSDHVAIVPQSKKMDQISAARTVIQKCEFDSLWCEEGLDGLRAWEFEFNQDLGTFSREPIHNWASHPSDGFAYGCQVMQMADPPKQAPENMRGITVGAATVSLEELWQSTPKQSQRI